MNSKAASAPFPASHRTPKTRGDLAALVRRGPHEAELVFIEPVDEERSRDN